MRKIEHIDTDQQKVIESYKSQRLLNDILRDELESLKERVNLLESESSLPVANQNHIRRIEKRETYKTIAIWIGIALFVLLILFS